MKRTIITCCAFLCYVTLAAQPASTDSLLMRYRQMALEYNDDLKAAVRNIEASMELERAARADRTPTLSAGADFKYTGNPLELSAELPGVGPLTFEGQDLNYGASVTLLQPVYTGGRIIEAIRLAESQTLVAEAEQELLHSSVCYQVDVQYWTAVARYELMTVADEFLRSVTDLERIVRERVEAGAADRQELLTVEVKRNEAEYRCLQAENDFKVGLMALNSLVGLPLDNATPVGEQVAAVDGAAVADNSLLRPELRIAEERIGMARSSMRLNDAQYKPQLYVGANGGFYAPGYDFRPDLSPNYALYAQVSVPIFHGGKRRREKRAYTYRVDMATDFLQKERLAVELETATARTSFAEAERRVALAHSSLSKAEENERRATEKYEEGAISIADVIDAQVYRQTAQTNHVAAKAAVQLHWAELLKAVNGYTVR